MPYDVLNVLTPVQGRTGGQTDGIAATCEALRMAAAVIVRHTDSTPARVEALRSLVNAYNAAIKAITR